MSEQEPRADALERRIRELAEARPPLTDAQKVRLAALLCPDGEVQQRESRRVGGE